MEKLYEKTGMRGARVDASPDETKEAGIDFVMPKDQSIGIIKVVGVGGGGCNAVRNMWLEGIENVTFLVCNTDSQQLVNCPVPVKLQLGDEGLGAGGDPDKGRDEAEKSLERIREMFSDGTKMAFVTASMGGGTGTGAGPVVARVAKEMGILTIGIVTIPFAFEGRQKIMKALRGLEAMRENVDALLVVQNDKLTGCGALRIAPQASRVPMKTQFKEADNILKDAAKSISELITLHTDGDINLDFRDVETTMKNGGDAIMAAGRASGEHRVERAIIEALDSPLLYGGDIGKARRILFDIYTSDEEPLYMDEMQEITDFMNQLNPDIDVIWGTSTDNSLGKDVKVIILAAGMVGQMRAEPAAAEDKSEAYLEALMHELYKPRRQWGQQVLFDDEDEPAAYGSGRDDSSRGDSLSGKDSEPAEGEDLDRSSGSSGITDPQAQPRTFLERAKDWLMSLTVE